MGKRNTQRALDLLVRSAANVLRLGDQLGNTTGWPGALRERVERERREIIRHTTNNPLEKQLLRQKANRLFECTVEYLNEIVLSLKSGGGTSG